MKKKGKKKINCLMLVVYPMVKTFYVCELVK